MLLFPSSYFPWQGFNYCLKFKRIKRALYHKDLLFALLDKDKVHDGLNQDLKNTSSCVRKYGLGVDIRAYPISIFCKYRLPLGVRYARLTRLGSRVWYVISDYLATFVTVFLQSGFAGKLKLAKECLYYFCPLLIKE